MTDETERTGRLAPGPEDRVFVRRVALVVLAIGLVYLLHNVADLLLLVFGSMLGALLLASVADWIDARTPLNRTVGLAIAAALLFGTFGTIGWLFGAETAGQIHALRVELPRDIAALQQSLGRDPMGKAIIQAGNAIASGGKVATLAWGGTLIGGEILANFLILLVGAVFIAAQPGHYRRGLLLLTPPSYRAPVGDALHDTAHALRLWLVTQLVSMGLMGLMIAGGLWLSGVPAWGALGLLGGLSEFVPYVGPTLAMVPALIIALAGKGSIWGVLATYAIVRVIQANVITPLISQRLVSVPPGLYLFLILGMGYAFGPFGLFFSGALAVTTFALVRRLYVAEVLGTPMPPLGPLESEKSGPN